MTSPPPEPDSRALIYARTFMSCLPEGGSQFNTHLLDSGELSPALFSILTGIFRQFEQGFREDPLPLDHFGEDQPIADGDDKSDEASKDSENALLASNFTHTQDMASGDDSPAEASEAQQNPSSRTDLSQAHAVAGKNVIQSGPSTFGIVAQHELKLDHILQEHLKVNTTYDAAYFFSGCFLPTLTNFSKEHLQEFLQFCLDVYAMAQDKIISRVHRLFLLLTVGDVALSIFGPEWWIKEHQELKRIVIAKLSKSKFLQLQPILTMASALSFICQCPGFGVGCIFWIQGELTDDFLRNRVARSGDTFQDMITHINHHYRLGLCEAVEQSGAIHMGNAIRTYLRRAYNIEQDGSEAMDVSEGGASRSGSGDGGENGDQGGMRI